MVSDWNFKVGEDDVMSERKYLLMNDCVYALWRHMQERSEYYLENNIFDISCEYLIQNTEASNKSFHCNEQYGSEDKK